MVKKSIFRHDKDETETWRQKSDEEFQRALQD